MRHGLKMGHHTGLQKQEPTPEATPRQKAAGFARKVPPFVCKPPPLGQKAPRLGADVAVL